MIGISVRLFIAASCLLLILATAASADIVSETSRKALDIAVAAKMPPPTANRTMAMVQTAVYEAVNAVTKRYSQSKSKLEAEPDTSVDAAVVAATRAVLLKLVPSQQELIERNYADAMTAIANGPAKIKGIRLGDLAAETVLASRADDNAANSDVYRPRTTPGSYIPTASPLFSNWAMRKPWLMTSTDQFRPGPPPDIKSETWARDYNEIKVMGIKNGSKRTKEQTAAAAFWETTGPQIYFPIVFSVLEMKDRDLTRNARFLAMIAEAMDDALVAVFDAKYAYNFWRPVTAIRNGDVDGNDATERDPSWVPFIETPMHPEYPCAHCIVASTVGTVIRAELGETPIPTLSTVSDTAPGVARKWTSIDDFIKEVSEARICDGVHFRNSTEVANAMGKKLGEFAFAKFQSER